MITICPDFFTIGLEKQFRRILKKHMLKSSLLNPKLVVQAVDFRHWQSRCLGILITPWNMQLMVLPNEGDEWLELPLGHKSLYHFPSGDCEFILSEEDGIGRFQSHNLFSPMFEFQDQKSTVKTAQQTLLNLMREKNQTAVLPPSQ